MFYSRDLLAAAPVFSRSGNWPENCQNSPESSSELVTAIREALQGRTYITPMIAGELLQSYREGDSETSESSHRLTARQREVLQLIAEGRSAKEVAAVLKITTRTAEVHKAHLLEALGLQNTAELVRYAIRNGIISV